ncbi:tRNA dimethylallyltransferase [Candidatus Daviesbacteria bacterium]|nr:tRNA dimethylallyltransferase [Candidatus Daviesbacteria bacterium]
MNKILVILGPTSTGKTDLALKLAQKLGGELVSVDSRQVYKNLDIGTGKLPVQLKIENCKLKIKKGDGWWKINGGKIWMYDVVEAKKQYTVFNYVKDASKLIDDILQRGKLPILAGGTGFYLKALLEGLPNLAVPQDLKLREKLEKLSLEQLQKRLQELSLKKWESMNHSDRQNSRRLVRAIELVILSLRGVKRRSNLPIPLKIATLIARDDNVLKIGLTAPREILYQRIDERVISRINQGMIEEADKLHKEGLSFERMKQLGLEYGVLADYLMGQIASKDQLIKILQDKIHGFARRQITWFKKEKEMKWFDIAGSHYLHKVEELVSEWYDSGYDTED